MKHLNTDYRVPDGLMKLHDEFLELARHGGMFLTSSDCRRIAIQLIYEMAMNPNEKVVPLPFPLNQATPANANAFGNEAA